MMILQAISNYLRLQSALLDALRRNMQAEQVLPSIILANNREWHVQRHGVGLLFKDISRGTKVDVHVIPPAGLEARCFDSCRLRSYFASLPVSQRRELTRQLGGKLDEHVIESALTHLSQTGHVKPSDKMPHGYVLAGAPSKNI